MGLEARFDYLSRKKLYYSVLFLLPSEKFLPLKIQKIQIEMASAIVRSTLRTALRGGQRVTSVASKRSFSSGASVEEEARTIFLFSLQLQLQFPRWLSLYYPLNLITVRPSCGDQSYNIQSIWKILDLSDLGFHLSHLCILGFGFRNSYISELLFNHEGLCFVSWCIWICLYIYNRWGIEMGENHLCRNCCLLDSCIC